MTKLGGFFTMTTSWLKSLLIPIIIGILLGTTDIVRLPFASVYPESDSIGGVAFPLAWVAGGQQQPSRLEFVLVRQSLRPMTKLEFMRRGAPVEMSGVFAGLAADHTGVATSLTGGLNGVRFLSLEIPEKTLGGMTIALGLTPRENAKFVVTVGDVTKDLADPDDLIIQTKNEARRTAVVYFFIILSVAIVSFYVARARPLQHPKDQSPEDAQWV
jgi:hypothetical protein